VTAQDGTVYPALLFKKDALGSPALPSTEYLNFIVQGAVEHVLPPNYLEELRAMESRPAKFAVPRARKLAPKGGGDCSGCGDDPGAPAAKVISITLGGV
jgi:hypothetical protein